MIKHIISRIAAAYSLLVFSESTLVGLVVLTLTFTVPNIGLCGIFSVIATFGISIFLKIPKENQHVVLFNSLMVGLCFGAMYTPSLQLIIIILFGCVMSAILSIYLHTSLTEKASIPILNAPFAISSAIIFLAVQSYGNLDLALHNSPQLITMFPSILPSMPFLLECFFKSFGMMILMPHVIYGLAVFILVLITSRYLAFISVISYIVGFYTFIILNGEWYSDFMAWHGFNLFLPSLVLSIFTVPSLASFAICVASAVMSSIIIVAFDNFFYAVRVPVTTLPFIFTTILIFFVLRKRPKNSAPVLNFLPSLPSEAFQSARLVNSRMDESLPHLHLPYFGSWSIYQGFDGPYTHQKDWKYAVDFHIELNGKPYSGDGLQLENYYCFGKPVVSPVYGTICAVKNNVVDNLIGKINQAENWGNYVMIYSYPYCYTMIAHLQCESIKVQIGEYVTPATILGLCGNSGRSPRPHIHVHVQSDRKIGGQTVPFRFLNVIKSQNQFCLSYLPVQGHSIENGQISTTLQQAMKMQIGILKRYTGGLCTESLITDVDFHGNLRIITPNGASVYFTHNQSFLSFYSRNSVRSEILDYIIFSCSFVPFAGDSWEDSPPVLFFPISKFYKLLCQQFVIFIKCKSRFKRSYNQSNNQPKWVQEGKHTISILGIFKVHIETHCTIGSNGIEKVTVTKTHARGRSKTIILEEIEISRI